MYLQPRDKAILKTCYEQQFILPKQIAEFFFSDSHLRKAQQRIQEMIREGLITREKAITLHKGSLLRLTKQGRRIAEQISSFEVPQFRRLDTATLEHDSLVTQIRLLCEKFWDGIWIPETALKDKYDHIPDGIFQFENSGTSFALEMENSFKGKARFQKILAGWEKYHPSIQMVLFFTSSEKLFSSIAEQLKAAPPKPAFGVVSLEKFSSETPKVLTPIGEIELFTQRSF